MNRFITYADLDYNDIGNYIKIHDENEIELNISHKLYEHKFIRIRSQSYSRTAYSIDEIKCIYCNFECVLVIGLCVRENDIFSFFNQYNGKIVEITDCLSDEEKIIKDLLE